MTTNELAERFISHAPKFYKDLELHDVDDKHSGIVEQSYKEVKKGTAFSAENFRNWKEQSDVAVPGQISLESLKRNGLLNTLARFIWTKIIKRDEYKVHLSTLLDDISTIKAIGGEEYLMENPVHLTPGATLFYHVNGTSVNLRWLRYIYLLKRIIGGGLLKDGGVWVDVGSYYGGLQGLVRKYNPESRIIMVDFHHQLCRSFIYLSQLFPDSTHILPGEVSKYKNMADTPKGSFVYVPVPDYESVAGQTVDLVTNFFSLGEMRREFFDVYMKSRLFRESEKVLLANRCVSSPFFEKTYESDLSVLDYNVPSRVTEYFDIFPMHHYHLIKRSLYGRKSFRNISSSYFEMVTSKAL